MRMNSHMPLGSYTITTLIIISWSKTGTSGVTNRRTVFSSRINCFLPNFICLTLLTHTATGHILGGERVTTYNSLLRFTGSYYSTRHWTHFYLRRNREKKAFPQHVNKEIIFNKWSITKHWSLPWRRRLGAFTLSNFSKIHLFATAKSL